MTQKEMFTAYKLPYDVFYDEGPVFSAGETVRVQIYLTNDAISEAVDSVDSVVLPFYLLATSGALSGDVVNPWDSMIKEKTDPLVRGNSLEYLLNFCSLDDSAIVVLSQMLISVHKEFKIREVRFSDARSTGRGNRNLCFSRSDIDPYPPVSSNIEFPFVVDEELGREINVRAVFSELIQENLKEQIEAEIFSWMSGVMAGAYGVAPVCPEECVGMPDINITYLGEELEWCVHRVLAHPSAFKGLVNVFASISHKFLRIEELVIE